MDGEQWELLRDDVPSLVCAVSSMGTSGVNLQAGIHVLRIFMQDGFRHTTSTCWDYSPFSGASFSEDEDHPHGPKTAVLSYGLWRRTFGADQNVLPGVTC